MLHSAVYVSCSFNSLISSPASSVVPKHKLGMLLEWQHMQEFCKQCVV
jgi:hypothetical protein